MSISKSQSPSKKKGLVTTFQQKYEERMKRTYQILQLFNPNLADEVFQKHIPKSQDPVFQDTLSKCATKIQKVFKGYKARKDYEELLYDNYIKEEETARQKEKLRMAEGLIMLENVRLEADIKEKQFLLRQNELERSWAATVIQRRYKEYKRQGIEEEYKSQGIEV